jgi:predicted DNA-binding protein (MmcQ/YjbR family)
MAKKTTAKSDAAIKALRDYGLKLPGAHLKSPWPGHKDLAVKDKTFAYLPTEGDPFSISCKLPKSSGVALMLPFCKPTGYGLGKSGWVSASPSVEQINIEMFKQWIDESYRAQAPKTLLKQLDGGAPAKPVAKKKKR